MLGRYDVRNMDVGAGQRIVSVDGAFLPVDK
jgi:hypothetical protein